MKDYENPEYKPQWICSKCGSSDVQTMMDAWFDPNDNYCLIDIVHESNDYDWCNDCEDECDIKEKYNDIHSETSD